ncbi:MAG: ACT domain-containing protein [Clostridia bacterium]|nr:ACT domain-containing protein [Clostridia bacterium]
MLDDYLIIHKSILPDYYDKVLQAKRLLEEGVVREVSQAVKLAGISRSTYYKYKDFILEPNQEAAGRKAIFSVTLSHEAGVLSQLLSCISALHCSVLTITQNLPIHGKASVTIALDVSQMEGDIQHLIHCMKDVSGAEHPRLIAIE